MTTIYCIEDINDLKYVGSTINKLNMRLSQHRRDKKMNKGCSSSKLNLENCIIYELETCDESDRFEREKYWIHKIDCVNDMRYDFDRNEWKRNWRKNNSEKVKERERKYRKNNPEKIKEKQRRYYENNPDKIKESNRNNYIKSQVKSVLDDMITHIELNQLETLES